MHPRKGRPGTAISREDGDRCYREFRNFRLNPTISSRRRVRRTRREAFRTNSWSNLRYDRELELKSQISKTERIREKSTQESEKCNIHRTLELLTVGLPICLDNHRTLSIKFFVSSVSSGFVCVRKITQINQYAVMSVK